MVKARSWRSGEGSLAGRPQVGRRAAEQPHQVGDRDIQLPWRGASPVAQLLNVSGDDTKAAVAAHTSARSIAHDMRRGPARLRPSSDPSIVITWILSCRSRVFVSTLRS